MVQWALPSLTSNGAAVIAFTSNVKKRDVNPQNQKKRIQWWEFSPWTRGTPHERELASSHFLSFLIGPPGKGTWTSHDVFGFVGLGPLENHGLGGGDDEPAALWTQSSAWLMWVAAQAASGHAANESAKVPRRQGGNMQHLPGPQCKMPSYEHANSKKKSPSFHHLSPCSLTSE